MSLLLIATTCSFCSMALAMLNTNLIKGPEPMDAIEPVGTTVTFTCVVNTTELPADTIWFGFGNWIVNGEMLPLSSQITNEPLRTSTLQRTVIQDYITGVPVQCEVAVRVSGILMDVRSNNTTLTAYGTS